MDQRVTYKDVEIAGRKFRIKKFNAFTGAYMLIKVTAILAPLFKSIDLGKLKDIKEPGDVKIDSLNIPGIIAELGNLSESDFRYVQANCLQVCSEHLAAGLAPVLNANGSFGVTGLDDDTMTVLALTVHALIFNVQGFFSGSPLASLAGGLLTSSQQGPKT